MLAALQAIPRSPADWDRFAWNNRTTLDQIRAEIQAAYNENLTQYILYPFDLNNPGIFLTNNAQSHIEFTGVLGQQSHDLEFVDLNDPGQVEAWINTNYQEVYDACVKLGVS